MPCTVADGEHVPASLLSEENLKEIPPLPNQCWLPVLQQACNFGPDVFEAVCLNLLKNPNINSSLLFRADILYDSRLELTGNQDLPEEERRQALQAYNIQDGDLPGFTVERTILRRMIPRNPQLDQPILQTCLMLKSTAMVTGEQNIVVYIPHTSSIDAIPWYHPRLQALAYRHSRSPSSSTEPTSSVSLHYRLFPSETLPLSSRLERTGQHLLSTVIKHGNGRMSGYQKRIHHDQIVSQQRVQDKYAELKKKHAKRLCDNWVEKTEPSKHVFEDLSIAAFLIELWRDMYGPPASDHQGKRGAIHEKPAFPGFVDIGCGNGVLVDTLIREGYLGWGFDARKRKTWDTFDHSIQKHLQELILIPSAMSPDAPFPPINGSQAHKKLSVTNLKHPSNLMHLNKPLSSSLASHNGIFPVGTFIISNHADELTPWTPLLASLSKSPFLCIPCCSHNLSGERFRAPSVFNGHNADAFAPSYFANQVSTSKAVPIVIAQSDNDETYAPASEGVALDEKVVNGGEKGDLKQMAAQRKKQPSAYSSLCDWVGNLAARVGFEVEKEMLRLPSTRNVGLVGRRWRDGFDGESDEVRRERVVDFVREEKADGDAWVERARGLMTGKGNRH